MTGVVAAARPTRSNAWQALPTLPAQRIENRRRRWMHPIAAAAIAVVGSACALPARAVCPVSVIDDRVIHIRSTQDIDAKRSELARFIWNSVDLPVGHEALSVSSNAVNPFACGGENLARVDQLNVSMGPAANGTVIRGWAWHFAPLKRNNRLVIVHDGHMDCSNFSGPELGLQALGVQASVNALVAEGYDVLFALMPLFVPDQCLQDHALLFQSDYAPLEGSAIRYFLDTTLQSVNYLLEQTAYSEVDMLGLSGGGWTTTLYAALDPRVSRSFPVAGSIPLYLRGQPGLALAPIGSSAASYQGIDAASDLSCNNIGDAEQYLPDLYSIAGYPDLYVMASVGANRQQVQILNRNDDCCFGQAEAADPLNYDNELRGYERDVRSTLRALGASSFRVEIDEASVAHQISRNALYNVILSDLDGARSKVGAASSANAFRRGWNGRLWQSGGGGWSDIATHVIGAPSVVENALQPLQIAARGAQNFPLLASYDGSRWQDSALIAVDGAQELPGGRIIGDPVALSRGPGQLDVVAQGTDFAFYHWQITGAGQTLERLAGAGNGVGVPALSQNAANGLSIYFRSGDQLNGVSGCLEQPTQLYAFEQNADGTWQPAKQLGVTTSAFPTAAGGTQGDGLFVRGPADAIWQYAGNQWLQITPDGSAFGGSPGRPVASATRTGLYARTADNDLAHLEYRGQWRMTPLGLGAGSAQSVVGSPVDTTDGVFWTGLDGLIRFYGGKGIAVLDAEDTVFRDDMEGDLVP